MHHAILTAAFTAEIQAMQFIGCTKPNTDQRRDAIARHEEAEAHVAACKRAAYRDLGKVVARTLITDAMNTAERIA